MRNNILKKRTAVILSAGIMAILLAAVLLHMASGLDNRSDAKSENNFRLPDTLKVGMLNSPTTYFNYRGSEMGYDYEMLQAFADDKNMTIQVKVASNFPDLMEMLKHDEINLVASPVPVTAEYNAVALTCGPKARKTQVVVQPKKDRAKDVTELVGRHITVEKDSKFEHRLRNLNSELGGGIVIGTLSKDTLVSEDMIKMVADGTIDMTVVDSDIAQMNMKDYPELDASLAVSLDQVSQWAVKPGETELAKILDDWTDANQEREKRLRHKYFGTAKLPVGMVPGIDKDAEFQIPGNGNGISPYDNIFRQAASESRFEWRLVAAVAYVESRFKPDLVSWAGAKGIMQVMPNTARALGFSPSGLTDPETCIRAGIKLLETLDRQLSGRVPDPEARVDFVLAAYNAGLGHIYDAIALADKYGLDRNRWRNGVEEAALMKSRPQYYRDPVVKNGYFRGRETAEFVARVNAAYKAFTSHNH